MTRKADQPDISDAEWGIIEPLLSAPQHIGRPREVDLRQVINGVFGSASICGGSDTVIETNHLYPSSNGMPPLWTRKGA